MSPYKDFSAWLEEDEPVVIQNGPHRYEIPPGIPTRIALEIQSKGGADIEILKRIMGAEQFDHLVDNTNTKQFERITEWAMAKLTGQAEEAEKDAPKDESPVVSPPSPSPGPTSSSTGEPSSLTQPAIGIVVPMNSENSATAAS